MGSKMNKTSGFRTIEFTDVKCRYYKFDILNSTEYCHNGIIYNEKYTTILNIPIPVITNKTCKICNGTGIVEKAESKVE